MFFYLSIWSKIAKFIYYGCLNSSMFNWFRKTDIKKLEEKTKNSFSDVKKDIDSVGRWVKHLNEQDKQLFDAIFSLKQDLSSLNDEVEALREALNLTSDSKEDKRLFKKLPVFGKQTGDGAVQNAVQTTVQTDNFYEIFKKLSSNERALVLTLLSSDMKLSHEDLALLVGKEKSTIRGQINSIKQKSENLIEEIAEKNGKKRLYIPEEIKKKLQKYAKVRAKDTTHTN